MDLTRVFVITIFPTRNMHIRLPYTSAFTFTKEALVQILTGPSHLIVAIVDVKIFWWLCLCAHSQCFLDHNSRLEHTAFSNLGTWSIEGRNPQPVDAIVVLLTKSLTQCRSLSLKFEFIRGKIIGLRVSIDPFLKARPLDDGSTVLRMPMSSHTFLRPVFILSRRLTFLHELAALFHALTISCYW